MFYLIHQAGKVASQSLEVSIILSDRSARVERHHYLESRNLAEVERLCDLAPANSQNFALRGQTVDARKAMVALSQQPPENVWILTGIRDPLDLAIAAFFQNLAYYCPDYTSPAPDEVFDVSRFNVEVDRVIEAFQRQFEAFLQRTNAGAGVRDIVELDIRRKLQNLGDWFDREFKPVHAVDLFELQIGTAPFVRFQTERANFIVYRMETFRENFPAILQQLPLPPQIKIIDQNVADQKDYAVLYRRFRERFKPTADMMEYYYGGRFFRHCYSGVEPLYSPEREGNRRLAAR
jgi:hypothetical protein